ncbi:MAG TPA: helix-turn-helix domain-containing protein, partial [Acidimicrobiales bacterium]
MPIVVAAPLSVSSKDRAVLGSMARSTSLPHRRVVQARGLLLAAEGVANEEIARQCDTTPDTVRRWRTKYIEDGVA